MDDAGLAERVAEVVARSLELPESSRPVTPATRLLGEGVGVDSVEILGLVAALEEEFGLEIEDEALTLDMFRTVGTVADLVSAHLSP